MKKILFTVASVFIISVSINAQTADVAKTNKAAEKQAKEQVKQKQDQEVDKALKDAGIAEDKSAQFKETLKLYGTKSTEIRKDASLTDDQRKEKLKALNHEKNAKLSEIAGADKYKEFNKIRKQQKQAESATSEVKQ
jgi:hypothetical protein